MDDRSIRTTLSSMAVTAAGLLLSIILILFNASTAFAAIGNSFMKIPDVAGSWAGANYGGWIRITGRQWVDILPRNTYTGGIGTPMVAGPSAPRPGRPNRLAISVDKKSPDLAKLMKLCTDKTSIPEVSFVEPSALFRLPEFPSYWEYKLRDVQIGDCDVDVPGAPEQAMIVTFSDIEWLNYDTNEPAVVPFKSTAADIPNIQPAPASAKTKTFLITWFGMATLGNDNSCPEMTRSSTQEEFYALLSPEEAAAIRKKQGEKPISYGGPDPHHPFMEERGPHMLNACAMPGIVPDPGHAEPRTTTALGVNLDGNDGTGDVAPGTCKHQNFISEDGHLTGVDNQLFRVYGCVPGYRGKKGYLNQTHNARRADGNVVTLIQISGIDNFQNDDNVEISIFYAQDKPVRSSSGDFVPNYTFRMTEDPNFARYNQRVRGRIIDGYIVTPPIKKWSFDNGQGGIESLADAQYRLHIEPDGNLKGVVGGYVAWAEMGATGSYGEQLFRYTCPGMYGAFKRNADGLKDPVTGECNGISMAYEIDAVPAFITPAGPKERQLSQIKTETPKSP